MRTWQIAVLTVITGILVLAGVAEAGVLTKLDRIRPHDVEVAGFILDGKQTLEIEAVGYRNGSSRNDLRMTSAWILDADTREVVWTLREADSDRGGRHLRDYSGEVTLDAGRYEVYYEAVPSWSGYSDADGDFDWTKIFDRDNWDGWDSEDFDDAAADFHITIKGQGRGLSKSEVRDYHESLTSGAIFALVGVEDNTYERKALTLEKPMELEIYAVGEATKEGNYDTSWILNTKTREKVWMLDYRESDRAGGVKKNRMFRDTIKLPAGEYAIFCATDNSHHTDDWNGTPPYDPYFWGLTIRAADPDMGPYAKVAEYEDIPDKEVVVALTKLGDDSYESEGFTLKKKARLRIYAIGEGHGDMVDYSWIIDANTREKVWEMEHRDTEHAGGGSKNRAFDAVVELEAGNYIAYAVTDDSHAYRDWNSSPPHDQEHWGLTVMIAGGGDRKVVVKYEEGKDESVLAQIVRVRDNKTVRERFTLDRDARVRVYALGEGSSGQMYDYAWIEEAESGRVVWEMSYRRTDHAGGAKKNRVYNDTIELDKGDYIVFYESDGSHSYNRWNATPPSDFHNWGVTVKLAKGNEK